MGRPRLHDEHTRGALLAAAERLVAEGGVDAVTVRATAFGAGTTTRAVYALFGSKDGLVEALAQRTFGLLMDRVASVAPSGDPGADLIACTVHGYRAFALEHPDLYRLFFTNERPRPAMSAQATQARLAALDQLVLQLERAKAAGLLGAHTVEDVTLLWDAVCMGLAMREICGILHRSDGERIWTVTLRALLAGLGSADQHVHPAGSARAS
jgi:AcrR family transcriptional regulator